MLDPDEAKHHSTGYEDEVTPLLSQGRRQQLLEDVVSQSLADGAAATSAPEVGEDLRRVVKVASFSSGEHWLVPDCTTVTEESQHPKPYEEGNPYLAGVTKWQFRLIFGGICFQYFVACFDSTLMASSHPVITSYFHSSNSASWLSTAFLLTSTTFQPLFGRISDTVGRRPLYIFALVVFALTTTWCALAQSIGSFIAARAVCGLGAGGVLAMGNIMINDLVKIEVRGTYQAMINLFFGLGSASGAAFGGFLCDYLGWRWTFGIQVPFVLAILVLALFTTPASLGPHLAKSSGKTITETIRGFDLAGAALLSSTVAFLILGLNLGGNIFSWDHPFVITSLVVSSVCATIFVLVELRADRPVVPMSMLFTKPRGFLVFSNFFSQVGVQTIVFNAPLYFQAVLLETPSESGFRLAAPSLAVTVCGVSGGFFMTYTGRMKEPQLLGAASMLIGGVCLSAMWHGIPSWLANIFIVPGPMGAGLMFPATSISVLVASSQEDQAVMTSTLSLWRNLGIVMGVSISSLIVQNSLARYLDQTVTGPDKTEIISSVRKSVRSIVHLSSKHRAEVMVAYERSLKVAFMSTVVYFVIVNILTNTVSLPRLNKPKRELEDEE